MRVPVVSILVFAALLLPCLASSPADSGPVASGTPPPPETAVSSDPPLVFEGWNDYSYFGDHVTVAGDVNGDGFSDFLVSAPEYDSTASGQGCVFLYLGTDEGLSTTPSWTCINGGYMARFGSALAPAGDVNDDGFADVLISSVTSDYGLPLANQGRVYLYLGSASGLADTAAWTYAGGVADAKFGFSLCTAGDLDSDGYDDVVIGAPGYDAGSGAKGRAFVFRGTTTGLTTSPTWTRDGDLVDSEFGYSVSAAGDVNADGFADFLVGSPGYETALVPGGGRAYLFTSAGGAPTLNAWFSVGGVTGARHGQSVAPAGDMDGDGYADVIVGAPNYGVGGPHPGRATVYFGNSTGFDGTKTRTLDGDQDGEDLGESVAPAGDVNGDGFADVVIGSPGYDPDTYRRHGRAQVFLGSATGLGSTAAWSAQGSQDWGEFGAAVCTAGDPDNDGFSDVIVGHPIYSGPSACTGRAYLYRGEPDPPASNPDDTVSGGDWEYFGLSAASAGDVNGDGFDDVIVGSPYWTGTQTECGRAQLFLGSAFGLVQPADWTALGVGGHFWFGYAVASAGDVNNDGYGDVIVGAPFEDMPTTEPGHAYLFLGSATGLESTPAWTGTAGPAGSRFGFSVASAGDVNDDGYGDVVVGAPYADLGGGKTGAAFCYYGSPTGLQTVPFDTLGGPDTLSRGGFAVASADYNGDGFTDVFVGSPYYSSALYAQCGRVEGYLGSAAGLADTPFFTFSEAVTVARCGWSLAGAGDPSNCWCEGILVGSPYYTEAYAEEGRALLFHGGPCPGAIGSVAYKMHQAAAHTGYSVGAGDFNGDGFSDMLVGAPHYDGGYANEGKVQAWASVDGVPNIPLWQDLGGQNECYLGMVAVCAGDVNGDGFDDILACAPFYDDGGTQNGMMMLYGGGGGALDGTDRVLRPRLLATDGSPRRRLGMSDQPDAVRISARSRGAGGRGLVRLEWNVLEHNSGPVGPIVFGDWGLTGSASALGSSVEQERLIENLTASTDYSLRLRAGSRSPYFSHTRWLTIGSTAWAQKHFRTAAVQVAVGRRDELPARPLVQSVYPNPFSAGTSVAFALPEAGPVRLQVFGIDGRLVATLAEGELEAGPHVVTWDGRDDRGSAAASGIYFMQLRAGGTTDVRRAILIR